MTENIVLQTPPPAAPSTLAQLEGAAAAVAIAEAERAIPAIEPPVIPVAHPLAKVLPEGWELATQQIRPIKAAPAPTTSGLKPTAPVMSSTVATMFAPILAAGLAAAGHPIPTEVLVALPTLFAFIGGWLHGDGRS
jgi:hypothetical protein